MTSPIPQTPLVAPHRRDDFALEKPLVDRYFELVEDLLRAQLDGDASAEQAAYTACDRAWDKMTDAQKREATAIYFQHVALLTPAPEGVSR
jgi:hypothetical protein